jgi:hypothetical protein
MTDFQNFISESILFSKEQIEQEALSSFATIEVNGIKMIAKEPTDLDNEQIDLGSHFIKDYSDFLLNPPRS